MIPIVKAMLNVKFKEERKVKVRKGEHDAEK